MRSTTTLLVLLMSGACAAQPAANPPATPPASQPVAAGASADVSTDDLLDAMERVGVNLKSLTAKVEMKSVNARFGGSEEEAEKQNGTIWMQRLPDGDTRLRVRFDDHIKKKVRFVEHKEFVLAGDWLVQRDYARPNSKDENKETRRQIRQPGQKTDLLKLGEGPFPLPIGQPRERVKEQFDVERLPVTDEQHPNWIVLELRPKEGTKLAKRYESITLSIDPADALPRVIETVDADGSLVNTTTLNEVKMNAGVTDADFTLEPIDDQWQVEVVPLQ